MKYFFRSAFLAAAASVLTLAACSTPHAQLPIQSYVPLGRSTQPLGELYLSNTLMRFAELQGEMKLQYVGQMPETAGEDLLGASVYRVQNWQAYSKKNAGHAGWCAEPPRWVTVNSETGAPAWSKEIVIGLLTLEDWSKYTPDEHRACAGGTYARTPS